MARILIAEDEPQIRSAISEIVSGAGHETHETFDGLGALYDTKELKPDVLLLDWMIPEMFGGEVLDHIRNDDEYSEIKDTIVIIVSDFEDETSREKFVSAGANEFVAKRDDPDRMKSELLGAIQRLLDERASS